MIRSLILYGFIASLLPAAGILVGGWVLDGILAGEAVAAPGMPRWSAVCTLADMPEQSWQRRGCLYYLSGLWIYVLGTALAALTVLNTVLPVLAAAWIRRDPFRMARCFGWVSGLFVTVWSLLAIPRFLIVLGLAYLLFHWMDSLVMAEWMKRVAFMVLFIPAGIMTFSQLGAMFRIRRRPRPSGSLGCAVGREEAPELYRFVENIARKLGMMVPAWLAVTIDTDFSVTHGPVCLPDLEEPLEGGVMSLSLPLLRVLTGEEVAGIIAHELGHLDDPVSRAKLVSGPSYGALVSEMETDSLRCLTTNWHLGLLPALFAGAVAETLHRSEANADNATLRVARPEAAALAFLKAVVTEEALSDHANINFDRLEEGVVLNNLSIEAADLARKALADVDPGELVEKIRYEYQGDPMEPSVEQRIGNFGVDLPVAVELLERRADRGDPARVGDLTRLEERASRNVHRFQQVLAGYPGPLRPKEVESMAAFLAN